MVYETNVVRIICGGEDASDALFCPLKASVKRLALLFGIAYLPPEYRINVNILEQERFEIEKGLHFGKDADPEVVAFSTVHIWVLSYCVVHDYYSPDEYRRVILHELVHVFQWITTQVPPEQYIWLYESVACFLAGQSAPVSRINSAVSWSTFKQNFYSIPECYKIAYHLGAALLSRCAPDQTVVRCSDVLHCESVCADAYADMIK